MTSRRRRLRCTLRLRVAPGLRHGRGLLRLPLPDRYADSRPRRRSEVEHPPIRHPHEEHRRRPLDVALGGERPPGLGDRGVDRETVRERGVELLGERDRGVVRDGELHADDRRHLVLNQRRGHAGEGIVRRGRRRLACVQDRETQGVAVAQEPAELLATHVVGATVGTLEDERSLARALVVLAVPDVVKDVEVLAVGDLALQLAQRRVREPAQLHSIGLDERL